MDLFALELIVLLLQKISAACVDRCLVSDMLFKLFGCVFISFFQCFLSPSWFQSSVLLLVEYAVWLSVSASTRHVWLY